MGVALSSTEDVSGPPLVDEMTKVTVAIDSPPHHTCENSSVNMMKVIDPRSPGVKRTPIKFFAPGVDNLPSKAHLLASNSQ